MTDQVVKLTDVLDVAQLNRLRRDIRQAVSNTGKELRVSGTVTFDVEYVVKAFVKMDFDDLFIAEDNSVIVDESDIHGIRILPSPGKRKAVERYDLESAVEGEVVYDIPIDLDDYNVDIKDIDINSADIVDLDLSEESDKALVEWNEAVPVE